jgi:hypothetical protein
VLPILPRPEIFHGALVMHLNERGESIFACQQGIRPGDDRFFGWRALALIPKKIPDCVNANSG